MKFLALSFLAFTIAAWSADLETIRFDAPSGMTRAELDYIRVTMKPRAVLVICPGDNGRGAPAINRGVWRDFAKKNNLGLIGLSFASNASDLHQGVGYYNAGHYSGEILLEGIRKIYGVDTPLLMYGFSGGAHFVSQFEQWKPERVLAWCAYSAGWWTAPRPSSDSPYGIVACGEDDNRLGPSSIFFKQGRQLGKPWLWICLSKTGHHTSNALEDYIRQYFEVILNTKASIPAWVNIYNKSETSTGTAAEFPAATAKLPTPDLIESWRIIHEP